MSKSPRSAKARGEGARAPKARMSVAGYADWVRKERPNAEADWCVRLVAKTPRSPAAKAVWAQLEAIGGANMRVEAVFTSPRAKPFLAEARASLDAALGEMKALDAMRVARIRNPESLPEQVCLGTKFGWSGDTYASEDDVAGVKLGPKAAQAAEVAFEMLWEVSEPVAPPKPARAKRSVR